jgi:hypothetical protein
MPHARIVGMTRYYDLAAANARLAELRPILEALRADREAVAAARLGPERLAAVAGDGHAAPGSEGGEVTEALGRMEKAVRQVQAWGITLRDIGSGLVDFPALASGRPIWLCWRLGERDIDWWHELDAGLAGRRPLIELE